MKKCFTFIALACVGLMTATATAQDTIEGTFVAATEANTVSVAGGVSPLDAAWINGTAGGDFSTGFRHNLAPEEIVTTVGGFNPGDVYNIGLVYTQVSFFTQANFAGGHTSGNLINVPTNNADVVGGALTDLTGGGIGASGTAYDLNIGPQTVNAAGQLQLFVDDSTVSDSAATQSSYKGITFDFVSAAAVPEPSSLAVLGLVGGLGLLRRRR